MARVRRRSPEDRGFEMAYAEGRTYLDADSHVMELPGWLESYADPAIRDRLRPLQLGGAGALADRAVADAQRRQGDAAGRRPSSSRRC